MKFLVLGCNGMAGHTISLYLSTQNHEVIGYDRKESKLVKSIIGDARDTKNLETIIKQGKFDGVINCIGVLNQFAENDHETATYLNAYFPHFLSKVTADIDTQVIHMSTDCVFSGNKGKYTETDFCDGTTFYDRSKALGELNDNKNITLRNSIIGPDINPTGIGLLNWFLINTTIKGSSLNGYTKTMWTGQTTLQLAKTMEAAARVKANGLVNAVPNHPISKCDLLILFNKYFRDNESIIHPVEGIKSDKSLVRKNFNFDYQMPDYEFMIRELAIWTKKYKHLYPHYQL